MTVGLQTRKKESWKIFDEIAKTYDLLNRILSMGIDVYWRHKLLKFLPNRKNIVALDLATGTGDVPLVLVKAPEISKVIGMDLSKGMVNIGKDKIKRRGLDHIVDLRIGDGTDISLPDESVDMVTISFGIRNFSDPKKSLREKESLDLVEDFKSWNSQFHQIGSLEKSISSILETFFHLLETSSVGTKMLTLISTIQLKILLMEKNLKVG